MATVTGLTAARMQEIIDKQIASGAVDLSGHLIFTLEDGSPLDVGVVKGDKGDPAVYPVGGFANNAVANYVRLGVLDGLNGSNGASLQFIISGLGNFGTARRGTVLVHASQRGVGGVDLRGWSWGLDATGANPITLYTRQMGDFLFEIWALLGPYTPFSAVQLLASMNSTLTLDGKSTVAPSSLVAGTIERSDSPAASTTLAGISRLATNAETQTGTSGVLSVTPAGMASVVGVGLGYRYVQTVKFESSGTFTKASYAGLRAVRIICIGGGGAGGGAQAASTGNHSAGGGGGGGGYAEAFVLASALAASVSATVGAGGTAVSANTGNDGGTTSFGSHCAASGGTGGAVSTQSALMIGGPGGTGGEGTIGDILGTGGPGAMGSGSATLAHGAEGGSSALGGGGNGYYTGTGSGGSNGAAGNLFGGGGGGGAANAGSGARTGGAGAKGIVLVELYR